MSFRIEQGTRAVVTGAGSGFGRAIAVALARRGGHVLISDLEPGGLEATAEQIRAAGGRAVSATCDVRDAAQVQALAERADAELGGTDVLVNNAGLAVAGRIGEIPLEDWRLEVDVNLMGVVHGCHHFVPRMRAQRGGAILNVASAAGFVSAGTMGPYNVTKAGVIALSETLAVEALDDGIHVSALCPTFFQTDIHKRARTTDELKRVTERLVTGSKWSADAVAEVALHGLERGELYIIPQWDGKLVWRLKRALGSTFYGPLAAKVQSMVQG